MKIKRITALAAILVSTIALSACGNSASSTPSNSGSPSADDALSKLQAAGVLKVGTEGTYAPFTYHDPSNNELVGYDVEVIEAVAEKLGVKVEFSETKWDAIFAGLEASRYDLIANEVGITDERKAKYDLTDAYSVSYPVIVTKADNSEITKIEDVSGKTTAQTATSNWADFAREAGAEVQPVEGFTEAVAAVKDGRVDLTFNDNLAALEFFKTTGNTDVKVAFEIPDEKVEQGFALRKDSGLAEPINDALKSLREDGTLTKIGEKYFGEDISQ